MQFKVVSDFQPTGDQPEAIRQLAEGIERGDRFQTLLGVTGSGKSLAWDEPVLIRRREGDYTMSLESIGSLIDARFETGSPEYLNYSETELISPGESVEVFSFNPESYISEWRPVTTFSRHATPDKMYRVATECGREVVVTGDHNFFSMRQGKLRLSETAELTTDDYIPLPPSISLPAGDLESIDLLEILGRSGVVAAYSPEMVRWIIDQVGQSAFLEAIGRYYAQPYHACRDMLDDGKPRGIKLTVLHDLLHTLNLVLPDSMELTLRPFCAPRRSVWLPRRLPITTELLTFLGLMLAEGHCTEGYAIFASYEEPVRDEFRRCAAHLGMTLLERGNSDLQISCRLWSVLVRVLVGGKSRDKHLPYFWSLLSQRQLGLFLRAYSEGDGGVDGAAISMTTASKRLASELGYAFYCFGIWARLHKRWKRATNSNHAGDWYHSVTLSAQTNLSLFRTHVGFLTERKQKRLDLLIGLRENTNVDVMPIGGEAYHQMRERAHLTKGGLARTGGMSRAAIIMIERDERRPSRSSLQGFLDAVDATGVIELHDPLLGELRHMLNAKWARVKKVEEVSYTHPYVYDFTVEGNETFLAGHGGMFVHNTFSLAQTIQAVQRPTLIISHNKTLAAQLYGEFKNFFPYNAVEFFISYYDYYQPEAYIPSTDTFIEKDFNINDEIDRLRLKATSALLDGRRDVVIVSSVSCIYGIGSKEAYGGQLLRVSKGEKIERNKLLYKLSDIHYSRNDVDFFRGNFRVRGDVVEVIPAYEENEGIRIEMFGDEIERISKFYRVDGKTIGELDSVTIYPAKHFVTTQPEMARAQGEIRDELYLRLKELREQGKLLEAQRLEQRTMFDLEMMKELGYCSGIENYSRILAGRAPGEAPSTLIDYFPEDFLLVVDESHVTLPQIRGMYNGDRARKMTLVEHGFRLPSALDNRPLKFDEFLSRIGQSIFVSATPADLELELSGGVVVEQIIRPTGLLDPRIEVRPVKNQIDDLIAEIRERVTKPEKERVLVTTLTKRMAEDLTDYLTELGIKTEYVHSEIDALARVEILRDLRLGAFDVLVGVNLLREGLDLPEVSLMAILDADKEGFLRSARSLMQTAGRTARHQDGLVIMYADRITDSMQAVIEESSRRRQVQTEYNTEHGIVPRTVSKSRESIMGSTTIADVKVLRDEKRKDAEKRSTPSMVEEPVFKYMTVEQKKDLIDHLREEMKRAAKELDFERAAELRDEIGRLEDAVKESK